MTTPLSKGLALSATGLSSASHSRSYSRSFNKASSYFIPRNSRGSLPVYSDIRNGGTRYLILVKNIRGNIHVSVILYSQPFASFLKAFDMSLPVAAR